MFWPKSELSRPKIFQIFVPKTPIYLRKIRSLDPTFWNPRGTHPPKKKLSAPPRAHNPGDVKFVLLRSEEGVGPFTIATPLFCKDMRGLYLK